MKFSLQAQIAEVDRELAARKDVYARLVAQQKLRQSHADYQMNLMRGVRATLEWLQENESIIKQRLAS
jgi:hypothetical protein